MKAMERERAASLSHAGQSANAIDRPGRSGDFRSPSRPQIEPLTVAAGGVGVPSKLTFATDEQAQGSLVVSTAAVSPTTPVASAGSMGMAFTTSPTAAAKALAQPDNQAPAPTAAHSFIPVSLVPESSARTNGTSSAPAPTPSSEPTVTTAPAPVPATTAAAAVSEAHGSLGHHARKVRQPLPEVSPSVAFHQALARREACVAQSKRFRVAIPTSSLQPMAVPSLSAFATVCMGLFVRCVSKLNRYTDNNFNFFAHCKHMHMSILFLFKMDKSICLNYKIPKHATPVSQPLTHLTPFFLQRLMDALATYEQLRPKALKYLSGNRRLSDAVRYSPGPGPAVPSAGSLAQYVLCACMC